MNDSHRSFESRLEAYLDGELTPETARTLEDHLRACATCRSELDHARELREAWTAPPEASGPSLWPEVHARVRRERSPGFRAALGLAVAASLLVGVLAGIVTIRSAPLQESQSEDTELWSSLGSSLAESGDLEDYLGTGAGYEEATP